MSRFGNIGKGVEELTTPCFLVDLEKVKTNCYKMQENCNMYGLKLRAQTKTHKTVQGCILQTGGTKKGLVCSTLDEAEYYADAGFEDILYGYPLIPFHLPRVAALVKRLAEFHVMVDSHTAVESLLNTLPPKGHKWSAFLKVDCGGAREGVWWESDKGIEMAEALNKSPNIKFMGLYVHCGNSYVKNVEETRDESIDRVEDFVSRLEKRGVTCPTVGIGSTPTCRQPGPKMKKLTELHPGNYAFLDVQQNTLGSCTLEEIAGCVATRVIGHYPHRNQMLIDCGFTGLTKQGFGNMKTGYGVFKDNPNLSLCKMTQEIGTVEDLSGKLDFGKYPIGAILYILPWHSCATAAMYPVYYVLGKDERVAEEWKPTRGW
ncbi:unnamed protein product [Meganyctiphanes norvegica]|uniref:D-serine dehydratase n=1 Tax=Meganyctiphanes norvegica TaxID=48144 RepID=A0AAV2Q551_MEGNR